MLTQNGPAWTLPNKAMSLLNVSTRIPKPAAALSVGYGAKLAYIYVNLFHTPFPIWPEDSKGIEV